MVRPDYNNYLGRTRNFDVPSPFRGLSLSSCAARSGAPTAMLEEYMQLAIYNGLGSLTTRESILHFMVCN